MALFLSNLSANLKAKYNFVDILNVKENIQKINDKSFINSLINNNRHFVHYKIAVNIFKENLILEKDSKHIELRVIIKNILTKL